MIWPYKCKNHKKGVTLNKDMLYIQIFFKIIFFRQESNQAMPWLADLVESNEGSFNVLPVQCLCEFLLDSTNNLMESDEESSKDQKTKKRKQVRNIFTIFLKITI